MELLLCIIAFLIGGLLGAFLVSRPWDSLFTMQHSLSFIGQIDIARKLRTGKAEDLLFQLETSFPNAAKQLSDEFDASQGTPLVALWVLKDYYEKYVEQIPEALYPIFESLAANPLADKTCYKLDKTCSSDPKCLKNPTSLQPLTDIPDPYGAVGFGKCGSKKKWWIWRVPCGKPVTVRFCV